MKWRVFVFMLPAIVGALVLAALVRYWYVVLPLTVIGVVLVVQAKRRQRQAALDAAQGMIVRLRGLRSGYGADWSDFMRAAIVVLEARQPTLDRVRFGLGVGPTRAKQLMHLLEQQRIVTAPYGSRRQIAVDPSWSALFRSELSTLPPAPLEAEDRPRAEQRAVPLGIGSLGQAMTRARAELGDDYDDFTRAAEQVVTTQFGSTSMLQRKMRIDFARAGTLMEMLERYGIVGPAVSTQAREVLVSGSAVPLER